MKLLLKRIYTCKDYTIGHLYVDGQYICDTIEDTDRGLDSNMPLYKLQQLKVKHETCIPYGVYEVKMTYSPKFAKTKFGLKYGGKVPQIMNVPAWEGVRIHPANYASELSGCVAPGLNKIKGAVLESTICYYKLMDNYIMPAVNKGEQIYLEITKTY